MDEIGVALDPDLPDHKAGIPVCPSCGSTDVKVLSIGYVANCNKCGTSFPFRKATSDDAMKLGKNKK